MGLKNKLNVWVENRLISKEEQDKIMAFEREHNNVFFGQNGACCGGAVYRARYLFGGGGKLG